MKISNLFAFASAALMATGVFADAANMLISFETKGPDKYADKAVVLDGEWYALVWSADGVFEGVKLDGTAEDPNDAVVMMAPLAKDGRCPFTVFQVDHASKNWHEAGTYAVYLLDTRNAAKTAVAAKGEDGKPVTLNAAVATKKYAAKGAMGMNLSAEEAAGSKWTASATDVADFKQPKIASFKVDGAKVEIKVVDMMPRVQYNVKMGSSPDKLTGYALGVPKGNVTEATFEINAADANFFQIVREPLEK